MGLISKAAERFNRRGMPSPTWRVPGLEAAAAAAAAQAQEAKGLTAAELAEQMLAEEYGEAPAAPSSYSLAILRGMQGRPIYAGTVPPHVKARRRAKNYVARKTRRLSRLRAK